MAIEAGAAYWGGPTASDIEAMGVPWGCALGALVATRRAAVVTRRADVVTRAAVLGKSRNGRSKRAVFGALLSIA